MAKAAKKSLLTDDKLAFDWIDSIFPMCDINSNQVM